MGEMKTRGPAICGACRDKRPCTFRRGRTCTILKEGYDMNGECNFAKAQIDDIAYNTLQRRHRK